MMSTSKMLVTIGVLLARAACAQELDTPPAPAAPRPLQIDAPREATLANGLRVIVAERRGFPLVTAQLLVLSGNEADAAGKGGLASVTADLLTKGTKRRSATAIANAAEALGGTLESEAAWDRSIVSMTITTPKLDEALGLIAEVAMEPVFAKDELDRLRTRSIDELKVAYASPSTLASLVANRMLYGTGTYGAPARGTPASLTGITRSDVLGLYRARYRPDNAVLVFVGDIDLAHATALARHRFGRWRHPQDTLPPAPPISGPPSAAPLTVVDMGTSGQAGVVVAMPLPNGDAGQEAIGAVTNTVLGGGFSSRLNQEIRIKRGLSYGARAVVDARREGGVLRATVQTKNESAAEVYALVGSELDRMADEPVPALELGARKATLIGTFSRSVETTSGLAMQIDALIAKGRSPQELTSRIERLSAVDGSAVQRYAREHYAAPLRRIAVAGDAARFDAALQALVPDRRSVKAQDLDLDR